MGTSDETPKKSSAQKGQGMLEYALMMSFVAMVYLIVFADGGFGGAITGTFDNANETLVMASEKNISGDFGDSSASGFVNSVLGSSSSSGSGNSSSSGSSGSILSGVDENAHHEENYIASDEYTNDIKERIEQQKDYELLDWVMLNNDIKLTFQTIIDGQDPDKAIASEYNLFFQLAAMTNNKQEYIYGVGATSATGWNDLIAQMRTQIGSRQTSSYVKKDNSNETLKITRSDNGNTITMTYTDGSTTKAFSLYAQDNLMQFKSEVNNGGTTTTKLNQEALAEYGSLGTTANIYNKGIWEFASN